MNTSTEVVKAFVRGSINDSFDARMNDALNMITALAAERDALKASNDRLVEAVEQLIVSAQEAAYAIEHPTGEISAVGFAIDKGRQAIAAAKDAMK